MALGAIAVLTFLLSCEILLQILGLGARAGFWLRSDSEAAPDAITILAVGDSHAYGAPLPREDAFPAQLEALLSREFPEREFRVFNRGIPGVNSAFVANRLEQQIMLLDPELVIVWVGANNRWNALESESWGGDGFWERLHRRLLRVKLYRLARVVEMSMAGVKDEVTVLHPQLGFTLGGSKVSARREGNAPLDPDERVAGLSLDMERMVGIARGLGCPILFVTYPQRELLTTTNTILRTGAELGVSVVDTRPAVTRAIRDGQPPGGLFVVAAGPHPTRILYSYAVQDMLPEVTRALGLPD